MASLSLLSTPLTHQSVTYISSCKSYFPSRGVFTTSTKKGFKRYTSVITAMSELAPPTVLVTGAAGRTGMFIFMYVSTFYVILFCYVMLYDYF